eukprot:s519_g13.t1
MHCAFSGAGISKPKTSPKTLVAVFKNHQWWAEDAPGMGNRVVCGAPQTCVDECARLHFEKLSREAEEPECDPAGAVFQETLHELPQRDREGLLFAGTSNLVAVRWLMILGSNPKARDRNGTTMLHAACRSGSFLMVQELLKRQLPVDAADSAGWTPLHVAAMMGRRELTLSLLQALGNPHAHNKRGSSPLDLCSDVSTREALRNVAKGSSQGRIPEDFPRVQGEVGEDPTATCEPFFVPRQPLFEDEANFNLLLSIGLDMARRSAAHALAFFVATGLAMARCVNHGLVMKEVQQRTRLFTFGSGTLGELGHDRNEDATGRPEATEVDFQSSTASVTSVALGNDHSLALLEGRLYRRGCGVYCAGEAKRAGWTPQLSSPGRGEDQNAKDEKSGAQRCNGVVVPLPAPMSEFGDPAFGRKIEEDSAAALALNTQKMAPRCPRGRRGHRGVGARVEGSVTVLGLSGVLCTVSVDFSAPVREAQKVIEKAASIPVGEQRLLCNQQVLRSNDLLGEALQGGNEVTVVRCDSKTIIMDLALETGNTVLERARRLAAQRRDALKGTKA